MKKYFPLVLVGLFVWWLTRQMEKSSDACMCEKQGMVQYDASKHCPSAWAASYQYLLEYTGATRDTPAYHVNSLGMVN